MFTIDAQYVPVFYAVFGLSMLAFVVWWLRHVWSLTSDMNQAHREMAKGLNTEKLHPLQEWSVVHFPKITMPGYERTRTSFLFVEKTRIRLSVQHQEQAILHFYLYFVYRIFRQPQGTVTLKTSEHEVVLQFYYQNGEEAAEVFINQEKIGSIVLDVKALPLPLADALLYDVNKQPIGKWACKLHPNEEVTLGEIRYGTVTLYGRTIAKMLAYNPKRTGKSNWQLAFDLLNLQIYPDSPNFHYHRGAPYFKEVNENLSPEQVHWLLALTALLLYKESWLPQGKRR
ncbi:MAG: hypothetical protein ACK4TA_17405 [Saprospiraceae bacterium]